MERIEIKKKIDYFASKIAEIKEVIALDDLTLKLNELEKQMFQDGFWDDQKKAKEVVDNINLIKAKMERFNALKAEIDDLQELFMLEDDLGELFDDAINKIEKALDDLETETLLSSELDKCNCFLEIHPGAGGTESQDWAMMLFRMYKRFSERHGFNFSVIDYQEALDAGIKSATIKITAPFAYGFLKSENGVHRLIRISPFDSNARRHTSFVGVTITPEIQDTLIEINPNDLRIDTFRSSGAGGQYVNTTDSAVRITHIPTGIVVSSQNERSQIQNRAQCMKMLEAKLYALKMNESKDRLKEIVNVKDNAFGSQIRTYTLQPYMLVKDHRTNFEVGNFDKVLDGALDGFINAYLKYIVKEND